MGNVRGGLVYSCLPIDTDPSAFLCGDIQFYYLIFKYQRRLSTVPDLALPLYLECRNESQRTIFYSNNNNNIKTSTSAYIYNNHGNTYKTTAITNIPKTKEKWSSYPRTSKSQLRRRKSEMLYVFFFFLFKKKKQIMILILLNSSHTLPNYLAHLPLPLSSRLSSHPIPSIHQSI